jgi:hypothetical protein
MSIEARRELLCALKPSYESASLKEKSSLLKHFISSTGYSKKYAITLLSSNRPTPEPPVRRTRGGKLGDQALDALKVIWEVSGHICGKRLASAIPVVLANLERHGHLNLNDEARTQLVSISPATIDRALRSERQRVKRSRSLTRRSSLVKNKVPVRTFADWSDVVPGFFEIDTVGHCANDVGGQFLYTLNMTDIATCWTVPMALRRKSAAEVLRALDLSVERLPFVLLGIDFDNGSEFLNEDLIKWCVAHSVTYTRSREYKKNDQAWIEEKNGSVVRKAVGRARYEGNAAFEKLSELYGVLFMHLNYFIPCQKLLSKTRIGSKTVKKYDIAKTPYQRAIESKHVSEANKDKLRAQYQQLDAHQLHERLQQLQSELSLLQIDPLPPLLAVAQAQRNATHNFVASMRAPQPSCSPERGTMAQIRQLVSSLHEGTIVTAGSFNWLSNGPEVSRCLSILAKQDILDRADWGVYRVTGRPSISKKPYANPLQAFVASLAPGQRFTFKDACAFAGPGTVGSHLSRLVHAGSILRVERGMYEKPESIPQKSNPSVRK